MYFWTLPAWTYLRYSGAQDAVCLLTATTYGGGKKVALPADQSGHVMLCGEEAVSVLDDQSVPRDYVLVY